MSLKTNLRCSDGPVRHLLLAGDICPTGAAVEAVAAGAGRQIAASFAADFTQADLAIVQWETPLTASPSPIPKSGPNLNCPPSVGRLARDFGADVALLANNHIGDQGPDGVLETMAVLEQFGLKTVGAGADLDAARQPLIVNLDGITAGILNVAEHEFGTAAPGIPGAAPLDPLENLAQIRRLRPQVDFLLMAVHGGHEYNPLPSPRMVKTYRAFAEAGADVVFNCHTHCPEPVEIYNGKPIIYSPGNFYFPKFFDALPTWHLGYLTRIGFDRRGIISLELIPYTFNADAITPLNGSRLDAFDRYMATYAGLLKQPDRLERCFAAWSAKRGAEYLKQAMESAAEPTDRNFNTPGAARSFLHLRNTYTCESHHDMLQCFFRLMERGELEKALTELPDLLAGQSPEWL